MHIIKTLVRDIEPNKTETSFDIEWTLSCEQAEFWNPKSEDLEIEFGDGLLWQGSFHLTGRRCCMRRGLSRCGEKMWLREWLNKIEVDHFAELEFLTERPNHLRFIKVLKHGKQHPDKV